MCSMPIAVASCAAASEHQRAALPLIGAGALPFMAGEPPLMEASKSSVHTLKASESVTASVGSGGGAACSCSRCAESPRRTSGTRVQN